MMSRLDLSRSSKGLMQRMEAMVRATLPRQARVTRTEGNSVWVKFLGDGANDPESKFPSTVSGVPVATMGWVITLGGRKGLFVATGIAVPIPFVAHSGHSGTSITTTSITDYSYRTIDTLTVPQGTYLVHAVAHVPTRRSVATGEMWVTMRVGGVNGTERGGNLGGNFIDLSANEWFPMSPYMDDVQVATGGSVTVEVGIRGGISAGTTSARIFYVTGTLTRIG